jgi:glucose-6-phosphate isomerase
MRTPLLIKNSTLPKFDELTANPEISQIQKQVSDWEASNFAGYRRLIEPDSDCFPDLEKIQNLANQTQMGATGKNIRHFVLLGTGGSSLGGEALLRALKPILQSPQFHFMDNNDPQWFHWLLESLKPEETLFFVVSKSGKTPETISQFLASKEWAKKALGEKWKKHFVFCSDPKSGDLRTLANKWEIPCLDIPSPVGGRFSVFTPVGLFPAAFAGLKIEKFLEGARSILAAEKQPFHQNPCAKMAISLANHAKQYPITVIMPYSTQLSSFSRWFCQLWAESLGKNSKGLTPYPAVGTTDQHSQMQLYMEGPKDKCILFVHSRIRSQDIIYPLPLEAKDLPSFAELEDVSMGTLFEAEFQATRDAITKNGIPNLTLELDTIDEYSIGALMYYCEWATAIAGAALKINPFDQPGVEQAKILTKQYLRELKK